MTSDEVGVTATNWLDLAMCGICMATVCFVAWLVYKYATHSNGRHR
jgi:hypothetical protein